MTSGARPAGPTLDHLRYLRRDFSHEVDLSSLRWARSRSVHLRRLRTVPSMDASVEIPRRTRVIAPRLTDLLVGLHGLRRGFVFAVDSDGTNVRVSVGVCQHEHVKEGSPDPRALVSLLEGSLPGLEHEDAPAGTPWSILNGADGFACAVAFGTPVLADDVEPRAGIDRILHGTRGDRWVYAVVATPLSRAALDDLSNAVLNELRRTLNARSSAGAEVPVSARYEAGLNALLERLDRASGIGGWHAVTYLAAPEESALRRLASLARASFARQGALPDPYGVSEPGPAGRHGTAFALPISPAPDPPGTLRYPFAMGSLVDSEELARLADLPREEYPGYALRPPIAFDVAREVAADEGRAVGVGEILALDAGTGSQYSVALDDLTRHALVVGSTGSGKTNTIFHLLRQLAARDLPFVVVEPTKSEYRALLHDPPDGKAITVFTPGRETVAPIRLNPFEFPPGISLGEHLDWLRSAFSVSLGLWTPLPQVLERCLHEIYRDAGWDPVLGTNARIEPGEDLAGAFPTLGDLQRKIRSVVAGLGYGPETSSEILGALETRIRSLRSGGRGRMLDVRRSTPAPTLFDGRVVLELEAIGADDDKAFVMALLLLVLTEHRRTAGLRDRLVHVVVVEEAHRILTRTATRADERHADPRGRAVEAFAHLLAEVRAYGQGVILVDQIPTRLAPDALKNTNLKIAHRLLADDDRAAMAGAMAMSEQQALALPALRPWEALVHGPGDDRPLKVRVPRAKGGATGVPDTATVRSQAGGEVAGEGSYSEARERACEVAESDAFQSTLSRCVQAVLEDPAELGRAFEGWRSHVPPDLHDDAERRAFEVALAGLGADRLAWRRGAQARWPFARGREFAERLTTLLTSLVGSGDVAGALKEFRETALALHARPRDPYPACGKICAARPALCLHRLAAAQLVADARFTAAWQAADSSRVLWSVAMDAGFEIIQFPETADAADAAGGMAAGRRAALCFAQQMAYSDPRSNRQRAKARTARIIAASGG